MHYDFFTSSNLFQLYRRCGTREGRVYLQSSKAALQNKDFGYCQRRLINLHKYKKQILLLLPLQQHVCEKILFGTVSKRTFCS